MRSESDGHVGPTSFPGLAARAAWRRGSVVPLVRSACDRYRPTVGEFLEHVDATRARSGWDESFVRERVERVRAVDGGFEVAGRAFAHVLVAPGHPGLAFPAELDGDARAVHAYEPHEYADEVEVVGAGMAAATEWLNALAAGARVDLRPAARAGAPAAERAAAALLAARARRASTARSRPSGSALLRRFSAPSYPAGREWDEPIERAVREGRFRVAAELNGAPQIVCATGFRRGYRENPLLRAARRGARGSRRPRTGSCSRPTRPCRRSRTGRGRSRSRARRRSGRSRRPTRSSARSTPRAASSGG